MTTPTNLTDDRVPTRQVTHVRVTSQRGLWRDALWTFSRNRAAVLSLLVVIIYLFIALFAPLIVPYDPLAQDYRSLRQPPSWEHLMGTDATGRDLFSRTLMGIRTAVLVAIIVSSLTVVIGTLVGSFSALVGGWVDTLVVWLIDALLNVPTLWLAAFVTVVVRTPIIDLSRSLYEQTGWPIFENAILVDYLTIFSVLSLVWWAPLGRLVRGQVLSLREAEFVLAARSAGASNWWITTRHVIPNLLGIVIIRLTTSLGGVMLAESSLSFLGIGIRPPGASLGNLIFQGSVSWLSEPHLVLMPGLALALIVVAFVFVGDALNDALNPRLRKQ